MEKFITLWKIKIMSWNIIQNILASPAGSFAFVFSIMALILFVSYRLGSYTSKFSSFAETIHEIKSEIKYINTNIQLIFGKFEAVNDRFKIIDDRFKHVDNRLQTIEESIDYIKVNLNGQTNQFTKRKSPISLTELGEKIAQDTDLTTKIENNWTFIYNQIEENTPDKNAYDIQEYCKNLSLHRLDEILTAEDYRKLKDIAFSAGYSLYVYSEIIAILIRDRYLSEKHIALNDIDKFDPNI